MKNLCRMICSSDKVCRSPIRNKGLFRMSTSHSQFDDHIIRTDSPLKALKLPLFPFQFRMCRMNQADTPLVRVCRLRAPPAPLVRTTM